MHEIFSPKRTQLVPEGVCNFNVNWLRHSNSKLISILKKPEQNLKLAARESFQKAAY
jgi:hypothetical protein